MPKPRVHLGATIDANAPPARVRASLALARCWCCILAPTLHFVCWNGAAIGPILAAVSNGRSNGPDRGHCVIHNRTGPNGANNNGAAIRTYLGEQSKCESSLSSTARRMRLVSGALLRSRRRRRHQLGSRKQTLAGRPTTGTPSSDSAPARPQRRSSPPPPPSLYLVAPRVELLELRPAIALVPRARSHSHANSCCGRPPRPTQTD